MYTHTNIPNNKNDMPKEKTHDLGSGHQDHVLINQATKTWWSTVGSWAKKPNQRSNIDPLPRISQTQRAMQEICCPGVALHWSEMVGAYPSECRSVRSPDLKAENTRFQTHGSWLLSFALTITRTALFTQKMIQAFKPHHQPNVIHQ